jgi:hypothetical protein
LQKTTLDVKKNEIARFVRLSNQNSIECVQVCFKRKAEIFQEDLYPDCIYDFGQDAEKWISGANAPSRRRSMNPEVEKPHAHFLRDLTFMQMDKPEYLEEAFI